MAGKGAGGTQECGKEQDAEWQVMIMFYGLSCAQWQTNHWVFSTSFELDCVFDCALDSDCCFGLMPMSSLFCDEMNPSAGDFTFSPRCSHEIYMYFAFVELKILVFDMLSHFSLKK